MPKEQKVASSNPVAKKTDVNNNPGQRFAIRTEGRKFKSSREKTDVYNNPRQRFAIRTEGRKFKYTRGYQKVRRLML